MKEFFHKDFRFRGQPMAYGDLNEVAYSLIKEGNPFEKETGDFMMDWIDGNAFIKQKTSGSTGTPKEIRLSKKAMVHSAKATGKALGLASGCRALCPVSLNTIAGKMMLVRAMVLGWDLYIEAPASDPLAGVPGTFDFAAMVPLQLTKSLDELLRIDKLIVGGAVIPPETLAMLPEKGTHIWQTYGMTETCSHIALRRLQQVPAGTDAESVLPPYAALEGVRFETDTRGCLVIHAPEWSEDPVVTNDVVQLESESHFRWLGRADHVINSGGVKLHPEVLEARLGTILDQSFFLYGADDSELGSKCVMVVEGEGNPEDLMAQLKETNLLEPFERPREIHFVKRFVRTEAGKLDRSATYEIARA